MYKSDKRPSSLVKFVDRIRKAASPLSGLLRRKTTKVEEVKKEEKLRLNDSHESFHAEESGSLFALRSPCSEERDNKNATAPRVKS